MKRLLALLVAIILISSAMAYAEPSIGYELPIVGEGEEVTIKCWGFPLLEWGLDDLENNDFTRFLYEQTGVKIEWVMGPSTDRDSKLNMLLTSGDYPEVIFNAPFDPSQQQMYGDLGVIIPLNDLIDEYGVYTQQMFEETPEIKDALVREGGKIYCLPQYMNSPHDESYSRLWFYQPWLDTLGLEVPTTTEELYDVLVAIRDGDPNGNGIADEIPLVGANVMFSEPFTYLVNSFIYLDNNSMMNVDDGTIIPVYAQEEYREALRFIKRLYDENLLLPQTFSQNDQSLSQMFAGDTMTVGAVFCHAPFVYMDQDIYCDMVAATPLEGPEGVQYSAQYYITNTGGTVITNKCEHPEIAFKMLDYMYNKEVSRSKSSGLRGKYWDWNTDETLVNNYGLTPTWVYIKSTDGITNYCWSLLGHHYQPLEMSGLYLMDMSPEAVAKRAEGPTKIGGYEQIQVAAMEKYVPFFPPAEIRMPQVFLFSSEDSATLADIQLAVNNKVWSMRTAFVIGEADLDADWDTYIADLKALGMDDIISIYQKAYDAQYK